MIIIEPDADSKLIQAIRYMSNSEAGCGHLHYPSQIPQTSLREIIPAVAQKILGTTDDKFFFLENNEVYMLAPLLLPRLLHKIVVASCEQLHISPLECTFQYHELPSERNKLIVALESRIQHREHEKQQKQAEQQIRHETQLKAMRRQSILAAPLDDKIISGIPQKRSSRESIELMMIEDDAFSRRLVDNILGKTYHMTSLENADLALHTYAHIAPNVLFLDINLPNVTGHELLDRILSLDPEAYIIMLSGNADRANVMQAMQRGAKGFVAKPFTPDKLYKYIERCPTIH